MPDYKKMYFALFNAVTNAVDQLQNAQRKGEDAYVEGEETPLAVLPPAAKEKPQEDVVKAKHNIKRAAYETAET